MRVRGAELFETYSTSIITWIAFGLIAATLARFLLPRDGPGGIILGIVGALMGGFIVGLLPVQSLTTLFNVSSLVFTVHLPLAPPEPEKIGAHEVDDHVSFQPDQPMDQFYRGGQKMYLRVSPTGAFEPYLEIQNTGTASRNHCNPLCGQI